MNIMEINQKLRIMIFIHFAKTVAKKMKLEETNPKLVIFM